MRADYRSAIDTHTTGRIRGVSSGAGVAKTTLVQRFKARALKDGNCAIHSFVPIVSEDLSKALAGQVLVAAYRTKSFDDIRPTLLQQYADHLVLRREENRVSQLLAWVKRDSAAQHPPTQKSLAKLWKVSQPAVSGAVAFLIGQGYVTQLPRRGAESRGDLLTSIKPPHLRMKTERFRVKQNGFE